MLLDVICSQDAQHVTLHWNTGDATTLSAQTLRRAARDAGSVRARVDGTVPEIAPDLHITAMQQVGSVGVNIQFSDGHDRAIYPFAYLRSLSGGPSLSGGDA